MQSCAGSELASGCTRHITENTLVVCYFQVSRKKYRRKKEQKIVIKHPPASSAQAVGCEVKQNATPVTRGRQAREEGASQSHLIRGEGRQENRSLGPTGCFSGDQSSNDGLRLGGQTLPLKQHATSCV